MYYIWCEVEIVQINYKYIKRSLNDMAKGQKIIRFVILEQQFLHARVK